MRAMSYADYVDQASRYSGNDPRRDDRLADYEQSVLAECLKDQERVQDALELVFAEFDGFDIADALIAGDECQAGHLLMQKMRKAMQSIAEERVRSEIESAYHDAMEYARS